MEYSFSPLDRRVAPPAGTLRLLPKEAYRLRLDLALLACEQGLDAFHHGSQPITRLELPAEPILDDMLAAEILTLRADGQPLAPGLRAFAHYSQLAREGLRPGETRLESSLEGIYQAVRNSVPEDLTIPENAALLLDGWRRIATRIKQAAADNADPFSAHLFDDAEFARQRTFLAKDHEVYRQDVRRGEKWRVQIPGGPSRASALLLRRPKSLFFKHFSREDRETPTGEPYLLLAVQWGPGDWMISTDPVQRISLQPLAEKLRAAEANRDSAHAAADPWFDGAAFGHTLVASPQKKSKLSDAEIVSIVRQWVFAKSVDGAITPRRAALAALATTAAAGLTWIAFQDRGGTRGTNGNVIQGAGIKALEPITSELPIATCSENAVIELGGPEAGPSRIAVRNPWGEEKPVKFRLILEADGGLSNEVSIRINDGGYLPANLRPSGKQLVSNELEGRLAKGINEITFRLQSDNNQREFVKAKVEWSVDNRLPQLHVLAIGVSKYKQPQVGSLNYADADAREMVAAFTGQEGLLFRKVTTRTLVDDDATGRNVLKALELVHGEAQPDDLVVIAVSGHGETGRNNRFYFLPHDFDPLGPQRATGIEWDAFLEQLEDLRCHILVVMDTCHSGTIAKYKEYKERGDTSKALEDPINRAVEKARKNPYGIVVIAACLSSATAREHPSWGHGALTMAVLEAIRGQSEGQPVLSNRPIVNLNDVNTYVTERVQALTKGEQSVITKALTDMSLYDVPIVVRKPGTQ